MRVFLISLSTLALALLVSTYSQVSAAPAVTALAKKPVYGQSHALVEKAGRRHRRWRRRWYRPRVYGYYYSPYRYRRWRWRRRYYRPRVYGYYYRPYRYRRWRWRRRRWW